MKYSEMVTFIWKKDGKFPKKWILVGLLVIKTCLVWLRMLWNNEMISSYSNIGSLGGYTYFSWLMLCDFHYFLVLCDEGKSSNFVSIKVKHLTTKC